MNYSCDNLPNDENIFHALAPECGEGSEGSVDCPDGYRCENGSCVPVICISACEKVVGSSCVPKTSPEDGECFGCVDGIWKSTCTPCQECKNNQCVEKIDLGAGNVSPKCRRCEDNPLESYQSYFGNFLTIDPCKNNCGPNENCIKDFEKCECVKCPTPGTFSAQSSASDGSGAVDPRCACTPENQVLAREQCKFCIKKDGEEIIDFNDADRNLGENNECWECNPVTGTFERHKDIKKHCKICNPDERTTTDLCLPDCKICGDTGCVPKPVNPL